MGNFLTNKNVILVAAVIAAIGLFLALFLSSLWDNAIVDKDKIWNTSLKFDKENAEEFPYSVKTKQGNLYASGELKSIDPMISNEFLDGEFLAIRETFEHYTRHESKSCDSDGHCTTSVYYTWDRTGDKWSIGGDADLLGQSVQLNSIPLDKLLTSVGIKGGGKYRKRGFDDRSYYDVVTNNSSGSWGFTSDDKGFSHNKNINPPNSGLIVAKWFTFWFCIFGGLFGATYFTYKTYEVGYDYFDDSKFDKYRP